MMSERRVEQVWRLADLLDGIVDTTAADNAPVRGLSLEAQSIAPGDLFLAVAGRRTHGLRYLDQALDRGAAAVVWEPARDIAPPARVDGPPMLALAQLPRYLGRIAERFFGCPSRDLRMIGVTGTDGKTSVTHFLAQALSRQSLCGLIGTLGYGIYGRLTPGEHTTPDAIRLHAELASMRAQGAASVVMEVSSHALAQRRIDGVSMDLAILTNLARDHLDYHESEAAYGEAKRRLFEMPGLRHAVINTDDKFGLGLATTLQPSINLLGYGLADCPMPASKMVRALEVDTSPEGIRLKVRTPWGDGIIESGLLGRFNASNLLAVLCVLLLMDVPLTRACALLGRTRGAPGRMQALGGGDRPLVVVDYAHTPAALAHVLIALRGHSRGRLWCVFGCGGDRDTGKRPLMAQVAERHADEAIVTDDNPRTEPPTAIIEDILKGFSQRAQVRVIGDRARAIEYAVSQARAGDIVLVAGKGHEQAQIVGHEKRPFDDSRQVARWLAERPS